ncbi:MAG TPA: hypothetical protein VG125_33520 [Pirellulales bacterium]|nr:hypothetical protein [Pirellulales bacterium]
MATDEGSISHPIRAHRCHPWFISFEEVPLVRFLRTSMFSSSFSLSSLCALCTMTIHVFAPREDFYTDGLPIVRRGVGEVSRKGAKTQRTGGKMPFVICVFAPLRETVVRLRQP